MEDVIQHLAEQDKDISNGQERCAVNGSPWVTKPVIYIYFYHY